MTYLVLEYCDRGSLMAAIKGGALRCSDVPSAAPSATPPSGSRATGGNAGAPHMLRIIRTAKEVATAVAYLHAMDVVHGDLKSANVLLK